MSNEGHDNDTCPHLVRANLLEARNKKLQTEVDHLMIFCNCTLIPNKELQAENARLKAEVERLEANTTKLCTHGDAEIARLKAEVERLTKAIESSSYYFLSVKLGIENARLRKAGDGLIIAYQWLTVEQPDIVRSIKAAFEEWNAAKEGNQSNG